MKLFQFFSVSTIDTFTWEQCVVSGDDSVGLAYHGSCLVIHPKSKNCQIYSMERSLNEDIPVIKEQGIYTFGGRNEYGEASDRLRVLRTGKSYSTTFH